MPQLFAVNRRRKKRASAARGAGGRFVKRHRAKRINPRKRRHVARRTNRRKHRHVAKRSRAVSHRHVARRSRHSRGRSRSRLLSGFKPKQLMGEITSAAIGAGGALALDIVLGKVQASLPASLQSGWGLTAAKIAGAVGLGWGAGKVLGPQKGRLVTYGALTVIAYGVVKKLIVDNAPSFAQSVGLNAYMSDYTAYPSMGYVDPAPRLGAYMSRNNGMSAYMPNNVDNVAGYDNDGM